MARERHSTVSRTRNYEIRSIEWLASVGQPIVGEVSLKSVQDVRRYFTNGTNRYPPAQFFPHKGGVCEVGMARAPRPTGSATADCGGP